MIQKGDMFLKHKRIKGKYGVWNDASNSLPDKDGAYLVILESTSPSERCQSWAGVGRPEINTFHESWHCKWSGRGTLSVAFWMPLPRFDMEWVKNKDRKGDWVAKIQNN